MSLEDSNRFFELINPGPDSEVGATREEHLRRDVEVQNHTGVPVKCLLQINCFSIFLKINLEVKKQVHIKMLLQIGGNFIKLRNLKVLKSNRDNQKTLK